MNLVLARARFALAAILGAVGMVFVSAPLLATPAAADNGGDTSTVTSTAPASGDQLDVLHPRHGHDAADDGDGHHDGRDRGGPAHETADPVPNVDPADLPIVGPLVEKVTPTVPPRDDPAPSPSLSPAPLAKPKAHDTHAGKHETKHAAVADAKTTHLADTPHPATRSRAAGPSTPAPPPTATPRRGPRVVDVAAVRPLRGTTSTLVRDAARRSSPVVFAVLATATAIAAFLLVPGAPAWIAPHRPGGGRSRRRRRGVAIASAGGVRPRPSPH
jgi:hypothetical protein